MAVLIPPQQLFAMDLLEIFVLILIVVYIFGFVFATILFIKRKQYKFGRWLSLVQVIWFASYIISAIILVLAICYLLFRLPVPGNYSAVVGGGGPIIRDDLSPQVYY